MLDFWKKWFERCIGKCWSLGQNCFIEVTEIWRYSESMNMFLTIDALLVLFLNWLCSCSVKIWSMYMCCHFGLCMFVVYHLDAQVGKFFHMPQTVMVAACVHLTWPTWHVPITLGLNFLADPKTTLQLGSSSHFEPHNNQILQNASNSPWTNPYTAHETYWTCLNYLYQPIHIRPQIAHYHA